MFLLLVEAFLIRVISAGQVWLGATLAYTYLTRKIILAKELS